MRRREKLWVACGVAGVLFFTCLVPYAACANDAERIIASVPIGTRLSDLDGYLMRWKLDSGDVMQWSPTSGSPDREDIQIRREGVKIRTEFGTFLQKDLGSYENWGAGTEERNDFTGEITFFHHPHWNAEIIGFTFIRGKLVQKDWGYLPG